MNVDFLIINEEAEPAQTGSVEIGGQTAKIFPAFKGVVSFSDIDPGKHEILIKVGLGKNAQDYEDKMLINEDTQMPIEILLSTFESSEEESSRESKMENFFKGKIWRWIVNTVVAFAVVGLFAWLISFALEAIPPVSIEESTGDMFTPDPIDAKPVLISLINSFLIAALVAMGIATYLDGSWKGQRRDAIAAVISILIVFAGTSFMLIGLKDYVGPDPAMFVKKTSAIYVAVAILIVYIFALIGKLDFSAPGFFWAGLSIGGGMIYQNLGTLQTFLDIPQGSLNTLTEIVRAYQNKTPELVAFSVLVYGLFFIGVLHFIFELSGINIETISKQGGKGLVLVWNVRWTAVGLSLLEVLIFYLLMVYVDVPIWLALLTSFGVCGMLVAGSQRFAVGVKTNDESFDSTTVGRVMLESNWDGVAFGVLLIVFVIIFTTLIPIS